MSFRFMKQRDRLLKFSTRKTVAYVGLLNALHIINLAYIKLMNRARVAPAPSPALD